MSTAKAVRERKATRRRWLDHALGQLETIPAVVAVWLWGSGGRDADDALSDWDIFVARDEPSVVAAIDAEWFDRFGAVLWWREDRFNAPTEGRYVSTGYPAPYSPLPIDWYLQPASAAQIGVATRILLERSPLPRVLVETHKLFPTMADGAEFVLPSDPVERVQLQLGWFWFMYAPMAKWAARGDDKRIRDQIEGLERVLHEAASLAGAAPPAAAAGGEVFDTVRAMGRAMIVCTQRCVPPTLRFPLKSPSACERTTRRTRFGNKVGCSSHQGGDVTGLKDDLWSRLRDARATMLAAIDGLSKYDLRRPMTPSATNLLGLRNHLAGEEYGYLGETFDRPRANAELVPRRSLHRDRHVGLRGRAERLHHRRLSGRDRTR